MQTQKIPTIVRQHQIVRAALELINQDGFNALNIKNISDKVGLVPSGIYRHYKNKGQSAGAVFQFIEARLAEDISDASASSQDAVECLHDLLMRHIRMIEINGAIPKILFAERDLGGGMAQRNTVNQLVSDYVKKVAAIIRSGQETGCIRNDFCPETLAVMFLGLIQPAVVIWHVSDGEFDVAGHIDNAWRIYREMMCRR